MCHSVRGGRSTVWEEEGQVHGLLGVGPGPKFAGGRGVRLIVSGVRSKVDPLHLPTMWNLDRRSYRIGFRKQALAYISGSSTAPSPLISACSVLN